MDGPTILDHDGDAEAGTQIRPLDELGTHLITQLHALDEKLGNESMEMQLVVSVLGALRDTLNRLSALLKGAPRLTVQGRSFYISNHSIQLDVKAFKVAQELRRSWKKIRLGELVFPRKTTEGALAGFADLLNGALFDIRQAAVFYAPKNGSQVQAVPMSKDPKKDAHAAGSRRVIGLYASLMLLLRRSVEQIQRGKELPLLQLRRAIKEIMESMGRHGGLLLALCYSPEVRKSKEAASVATMLHALVVGQLLHMPRRALLELGLSALLADLPRLGGADGERRFPLLEEALEDDPELKVHMLALANLVNGPGLNVDALSPPVVLFEGPDIFSRPNRYSSKGAELNRPFLYSRIIAVCSLYDQLVWPWRPEGEELALEQRVALWDQVMAELDPVVVRVFIEFMGLFPIGSIVTLDTQELGVVVAQRKGSPDRPMVLTVIDEAQGLRVSGPLVDLAKEPDRRILGLANASALGVNPVACFMSRKK